LRSKKELGRKGAKVTLQGRVTRDRGIRIGRKGKGYLSRQQGKIAGMGGRRNVRHTLVFHKQGKGTHTSKRRAGRRERAGRPGEGVIVSAAPKED